MKQRSGDCAARTVATREPSRVPPSRPSGRVSTIARQNSLWSFRFYGDGDIAAERRRVRDLFERHGFSVGRRQRGALTGVMFGDFDIQKWRNLRPADIDALHGKLNEDYLPLSAQFSSGLPDDVDDALLALSNEESARLWPQSAASADTHPKGGDSTEIEAPLVSGAVGNAETPNPSPESEA